MKKPYKLLICTAALMLYTLSAASCSLSEFFGSPTENGNEVYAPEAASPNDDPLADYMNYVFELPEYGNDKRVTLNSSKPCFTLEERAADEYLVFSELDELGRCGPAFACIGSSMLPTEKRGEIGMVKPAGWQTARYDFIDGGYLYNRCHLIAYELCGVNADERNLITGTRYMNVEGMLSIENRVYEYVRTTGNHVCYRVTPRYEGSCLVAAGVEMEAFSVEDKGKGICLHCFCFNVQPGVEIDYQTGENRLSQEGLESMVQSAADSSGQSESESSAVYTPSENATYILNTNSMRFHLPDCQSVQDMSEKNRREYFGTREELIAQGYIPCGACKP